MILPAAAQRVRDFLVGDWASTLFPLASELVFADRSGPALSDYLRKQAGHLRFPRQLTVYASKPKAGLRRTFKLDPLTSWYWYGIVHRHRKKFILRPRPNRMQFGYQFRGSRPTSGKRAYAAYRTELKRARKQYKELAIDVATYFNDIDHEPFVRWFWSNVKDEADKTDLEAFLAGCSRGGPRDCLPQGLFPSKVLGNSYLSLVDKDKSLRSKRIVRFMDDIHFFDRQQGNLWADFYNVQRLLGNCGLNINPRKSKMPGMPVPETVAQGIDKVRAGLLRKRALKVTDDYVSDEDDEADENGDDDEDELTEEELEYLVQLLDRDPLDEQDAELALSLLNPESQPMLEHLGDILLEFPNLAKEVHRFCARVDTGDLVSVVADALRRGGALSEFQIFWIEAIVTDYLFKHPSALITLHALHEHPNATILTRAKLYEIPYDKYGLHEWRKSILREAKPDWMTWASAVGSQHLSSGDRRQLLRQFATSDDLNRMLCASLLL